jgi:MATE family multidrug resistance protein
LLIGSTFFVVDGLQTVSAGALRGLNDTRIPLLIAAVSFWLVGFVACYVLAFPLHLGVDGVWMGFTIGLAVYAALLLWRFDALTRRGFMPTMVPSPSH